MSSLGQASPGHRRERPGLPRHGGRGGELVEGGGERERERRGSRWE